MLRKLICILKLGLNQDKIGEHAPTATHTTLTVIVKDKPMTELVLAVNRQELDIQGVGTNGIYPIDLSELNQQNYAYLPRTFADNKSENAIALGVQFPQILGYFQIMYQGNILTYQRKGKEKGLLGKWSIGVGGHVSQEDFIEYTADCMENYPSLASLVYTGAVRELQEELGISTRWIDLGYEESFCEAVTQVIATFADPTSTVHVGLPLTVELPDHLFEALNLDPAEFNNIKWLSPHELKTSGLEFETWSQLLVDQM